VCAVTIANANADGNVIVCIPIIGNNDIITKCWSEIATDCVVFRFGLQCKFPRWEAAPILLPDEKTVQAGVAPVAVASVPLPLVPFPLH
jgi:hypothetical protein